jgi:Putative MetA-pathway of phenol degradation
MIRLNATLRKTIATVAVACACGPSSLAAAQELEPRAFTPSPVGTTFYLAGLGRSNGGILLDPSLDVGNVQARFWAGFVGIGHTFDLFGQQARIMGVLPYVHGEVTGAVGQTQQRRELKGFADPRIKFSFGLFGLPALKLEEFAKKRKDTAIGASLTVMPPMGQYDPNDAVTVGYNRWAFKPELGLSRKIGSWLLEVTAGVWLFTDNDEYFPADARRQQQPIYALQGHLGYTFADGTWLAFNATGFEGGQTKTNGVKDPNRQDNVRLGLTLSLPLPDNQSIKLAYSTGASTLRGSDFDTFNVTWQLVQF